MSTEQQQTLLRVQTNKPSDITITGDTSLTIYAQSMVYTGTGISNDPYMGTYPNYASSFDVEAIGDGYIFYDITLGTPGIGNNYLVVSVKHAADTYFRQVFTSFSDNNLSYFRVKDKDVVRFRQGGSFSGSTFSVYMNSDVTSINYSPTTYENLDLYNDIPIKINKSFAEIEDISKRNSDYSIGLRLPGTKQNNSFFENFYNVDNRSLYFDVTSKVACDVLINDQKYFSGYLKLNKISVINSKVEYDVTIFSNIADLYGQIGNNLLCDLDFRDIDYNFNHIFCKDNVLAGWKYETLKSDQEVPSNYFYPVVHNGYNYLASGQTTQVLMTGLTGTSLYTTTKIGSWTGNTAAYAAGVERYRINSPEDGIRDNQLKPALNVYSLLKLMFKTYGYTVKSDFMSSPWMKLLYMYGYFSNDSTKLSFKTPKIETFSKDQVEFFIQETSTKPAFNINQKNWNIYVVKKGTGTPVMCSEQIVLSFDFKKQDDCAYTFTYPTVSLTIPANTTGTTYSWVDLKYIQCGPIPFYDVTNKYLGVNLAGSEIKQTDRVLAYEPATNGAVVPVLDDTYLDFSLVIDESIKQIDFLSSICKKFGLLLIPDPEIKNQIIIEPYDYFIGTGTVYDWTDKLSWDKGFTVEPAQNFIESEVILTDLDDGDQGNKDYKASNSKVYGENVVSNPTSFKSQSKKIETTFSPEVFRKWNPNNNTNFGSNDVAIPLGINYTEQSQEISSGDVSVIDWVYKGCKTKPKLFFNLGNFSPFLDQQGENISLSGVTTAYFRVTKSDGTSSSKGLVSPVISHTMPIGNPDTNKINNDSISILFQSEEPTTIAGDSIVLFDTYTSQDMYNLFYENRISNSFDKNTRMLSGNFNLSLKDVNQLKPQDLIKINEQYFTLNLINGFNLTEKELTQVELIQMNRRPKEYPTRYFKYSYCDLPGTVYKFKTQFTNATSVQQSLYYYSILYDFMIGSLGGTATGYTSSLYNSVQNYYTPYSIYEVSKSDYDASGTLYDLDPLKYYFLLSTENYATQPIYDQNNSVWLINSGSTMSTLNVFTGCTAFTTATTALGVRTGFEAPAAAWFHNTEINVTTTGWIMYETPDNVTVEVYYDSTGSKVISECNNRNSIRPNSAYGEPAIFTLVDPGSPCS